MKNFRNREQQKGQFVIEAVLLMMLSVGLFITGTRILREKKVVESVVQGSWSRVSTMTESGVWGPYGKKYIEVHPNKTQSRGVTLLEFQ